MTLFREEARKTQQAPMIGKIVLIRPMSFGVLTTFSMCSAIALVAFFTWGSYTRRTTVDGVVTPSTGLVKVWMRNMLEDEFYRQLQRSKTSL
ncbi:hypothetical protein [Burkholderia sp. 3C]